MHIIYLHQHFALPSGSTGTRSYEMARRWVAAGHQVTVICGRGDICGLPATSSFEAEGVRVCVVGASYSQKHGFLRRLFAFLYFMAACTVRGLAVRKVDVIFATSTPLTIGIPAMLLKWLKRRPFVFEVRDQWPEVPIAMGYINSPVLQKLLLWLERRIYRSAAGIVALSPGMAEGVRQVLGATDKPLIVAPNSADLDCFRPDIDGAPIRTKMGWQDKFIVLHFGTVGHANRLDFLLDAATRLIDKTEICFVVMGSGRENDRLKQKAKSQHLTNVQFLDRVSKTDLPVWVAACDLSTVIFAEYPILEHNSANKFFDSLAAGKPVLLNYGGWQRERLETHTAGLGCRQWDLDEYINNLLTLYNDRERLQQMGQNARILAEDNFSRDIIAQQILNFLEDRHV